MVPKLTTKLLSGRSDSRNGAQNISRASKGSRESHRNRSNKSIGKIKTPESSKSSEKTNIQFFKKAKKNLLMAEQVFDNSHESMSSLQVP